MDVKVEVKVKGGVVVKVAESAAAPGALNRAPLPMRMDCLAYEVQVASTKRKNLVFQQRSVVWINRPP